jgi:hypothetical protein
MWTIGYREQDIASIFDALPCDFCRIIQAASDRTLRQVLARATAPKRLPAPLSEGEGAGWEVAGGEGGEEGFGTFMECLEDLWEREEEVGFMELAFDPVTQRRANVVLNSRCAAMAGMHKEEVLARLAAHDAPVSFVPLDFLRVLLHQASAPAR